jgi:hypothetical protein
MTACKKCHSIIESHEKMKRAIIKDHLPGKAKP